MLNAPAFQLTIARSDAVMVPTLPAPLQVAVPLTFENGWTVGLAPCGTAASSGLGSIDIGPTANIAMNNLRRDNLTGGAFFICEYTEQFVTRLRLTLAADGRRGGAGKKILRQANPLRSPQIPPESRFSFIRRPN